MQQIERYFKLTDDMVNHLNGVVNAIGDPFIKSRYSGFVAVAAVTVYELAIKYIFCDFAERKNIVFGEFTRSHFNRIDGRIKRDDIEKYINRFGDKYIKRFKRKMDRVEKEAMRIERISVKGSYANLIDWRNEFAHGGQIPAMATYEEVVKSYVVGKQVIVCLKESMNR